MTRVFTLDFLFDNDSAAYSVFFPLIRFKKENNNVLKLSAGYYWH